ncbi:erythropoiesis-stimulating protein [Streptomyces sp. PBH53]|uniref:LuxR C-terminal-related transcriptional regulator n=4 Tax=Streptomyces TaxID=1883 RepID=A0ABS9JHY8_9ACTN|nr:LuxR C-terminal-related transcriptional regulator [Streptomyces tricolor]AKN70370.1 erythropoiesis-stimulating protein [Streptomyces sp. PBH53]MCG0065178.1 LuxR C-terminal-related transcriptional regulator [Streptomyces tricolor]OYP16716.1 LuxR family transcriptional regulator [Streptomyces sp. FBKL.4005]
MPETLGMEETTELVYRTMLAHPSEGFDRIRELTGLAEADLRTQLNRLSELALVRPAADDPNRMHAVSPQIGMKVLLAERQAELAAAQQQLEDARYAAERIIAEFSQVQDSGNGEIEKLYHLDEIRDRIRLLCAEVKEEVMAFTPDGAQTAANMEAAKPQDAELLRRGVRMRTLYLDSLRNNPPTVAYANWLAEQGGQVRTVPSLPIRMLIMDRATALVPVTRDDSSMGAVVLRGEGILAALCGLFESTWERATPLGSSKAQERDDRGLTPSEAEVLKLLAKGHTDETIAKRVGVSSRTVRRIAADLMDKMDARSRFQAGAQAALRGWITLDDATSTA